MTPRLKDIKWNEKSSIVDFVKTLHVERLSNLRDHHQEMYMNVLWAALGRQDIFYHRHTRTLIDLKPPMWRVRLISNLLFPQFRRIVAKLARRPIWDVLPATHEQADINTASIGKTVLEHYWFELGMQMKFIEHLTWLAVTGNAFFKIGWDQDAGEQIILSDQEKAILIQLGVKKPPKKLILGEPFIDVPSPFSVFWEPGVSIQDSSWIIEHKLRSPDYIWKRWKKEVKPSKPTGEKLYDYHIMNMMESALPAGETTDQISTLEFFTPEKHIMIVGSELVWPGENEYADENAPHSWNPYVHSREVIIPGSEHGMSSIRQNRLNQAQYNKTRSMILETINLMSNPKWLVPMGADLKRGVFTNRPGETILYNPPFKPEQSQPKPMPAYVERFLAGCKEDMRDVGSSAPVSQAKGEPNLRSGKAVLALQDADDLILGPTSQGLDITISILGTKLLRVVANNVHEERLLKYVGDSKRVQIRSFTGQDLIGQEPGKPGINRFDVRVTSYTTYPMSRQGMEERINWLLERQVLHPQQDREQILSMLGSGDIQSAFDPIANDRALAVERCYRLEQGQDVLVTPLDNHTIMIEELDRYFKPKMEELMAQQDPIAEKILEYRKQHEQILMAKQIRLQQQIMEQGNKNG